MTVADVCVDLILRGNVHPQFHQVEQIVGDCTLELGGSATIFASQLVKLGARAAVIGWAGQDGFGDFILQQLRKTGVDTTRVKRHPVLKTGIGVALTEENDRAILTYMGTIDATRTEDVQENVLASCRHWHIASYFLLQGLRPFWRGWLQKCRAHGVTTSLDTNWDPDTRWDGVSELLPYIDIFLPNEAEALAISGESDVLKAARKLAGGGPLVAVKRGEKGSLAVKDGKTWEIKPDDAPVSVVDSTGAGDNFDAGFIRSWLLGRDIEACLRLGHRCGLSSLSCPGGTRGQLVEKVK